jgi:hypothetical protein
MIIKFHTNEKSATYALATKAKIKPAAKANMQTPIHILYDTCLSKIRKIFLRNSYNQ